jgi:hypothetical protein
MNTHVYWGVEWRIKGSTDAWRSSGSDPLTLAEAEAKYTRWREDYDVQLIKYTVRRTVGFLT